MPRGHSYTLAFMRDEATEQYRQAETRRSYLASLRHPDAETQQRLLALLEEIIALLDDAQTLTRKAPP